MWILRSLEDGHGKNQVRPRPESSRRMMIGIARMIIGLEPDQNLLVGYSFYSRVDVEKLLRGSGGLSAGFGLSLASDSVSDRIEAHLRICVLALFF
jgi:hypothetical protein